ncbi:hypothetical protein CBW65_14730 [Tumebacillus avium]|uniref:Uncharacterized protein n=1 Tax=Tumebacillus avium TaxID=1903704 RepID=A0A1Y0IRW7_9BACL|nr:hypothetical protein [Tumebacillus avium]ARU62113.1 hypothetical protein CBW65_14730 [Tumebacillus avium]
MKKRFGHFTQNLQKGVLFAGAFVILFTGGGIAEATYDARTAVVQPEVADIDCSDFETYCKKAILSSGQRDSNSYYLWVPQGLTVYYYVENTGYQWPVSCKVFRQGLGEVPNTTKQTSYFYGANTGGYFVSEGDYYFIQIHGGDSTEPYTATGFAEIKYYRPY